MKGNLKKGELPFKFLCDNPGWHALDDICMECRMTRYEVSHALRNFPVEKKSCSRKETLMGAAHNYEYVGDVHSTAYRVV